MKSVGLNDEIYQKLLRARQVLEKKLGRVISFEYTIGYLIDENKKLQKTGKNQRLDI